MEQEREKLLDAIVRILVVLKWVKEAYLALLAPTSTAYPNPKAPVRIACYNDRSTGNVLALWFTPRGWLVDCNNSALSLTSMAVDTPRSLSYWLQPVHRLQFAEAVRGFLQAQQRFLQEQVENSLAQYAQIMGIESLRVNIDETKIRDRHGRVAFLQQLEGCDYSVYGPLLDHTAKFVSQLPHELLEALAVWAAEDMTRSHKVRVEKTAEGFNFVLPNWYSEETLSALNWFLCQIPLVQENLEKAKNPVQGETSVCP